MTFAEKLKKARQRANLSQAELADKLGLNLRTYGSYERGERDVSTALLRQICLTLNVSSDDLINTDKPNAEIISHGQNIYQIPVFESVSAGFGAYACSDVIDYLHLYIANPADVSDMLCIKVSGSSMYPKIENGDIIVVRKQSSVDSGSIAVVLVDDEEGFVKRVVYDDDTIELQSINPEYAPKIFKGADVLRVRVVGLVKQVIKNL
jgi:repressor LexA